MTEQAWNIDLQAMFDAAALHVLTFRLESQAPAAKASILSYSLFAHGLENFAALLGYAPCVHLHAGKKKQC